MVQIQESKARSTKHGDRGDGFFPVAISANREFYSQLTFIRWEVVKVQGTMLAEVGSKARDFSEVDDSEWRLDMEAVRHDKCGVINVEIIEGNVTVFHGWD